MVNFWNSDSRHVTVTLSFPRPNTASLIRKISVKNITILLMLGLLFVCFYHYGKEREPKLPVARYPGACPSAEDYLTSSIPCGPQGIPKILHQVYKDFELPNQYQDLVQRCSKINNDFLHILWTDDDFQLFLVKKRPEWMATFNKYISGIQKSDVMRLMILEHFGGVYIDLDVECRKPLSAYLDIHNATCIFDREPELQTQVLHRRTALLMNSVILTVPHHPFFTFLIDKLGISLWESDVLQRTGPFFITDRYLEYRRINRKAAETIYHAPSSDFSPVMDPKAVDDFDNYCRWRGRLLYGRHPLFIKGCALWKKERSFHRSEIFNKKKIEKAYLVHWFMHLGYVKTRDSNYFKKFSVCDELPTITRYGSMNLT